MRSIFSSSLMRALHLFCFGGLGAEAVDEGFKMLDLIALIAVSGDELIAPLVLLTEIFCVVTLIDRQPLIPYLYRAVDRNIEKVAIVGDKYVAKRIVPGDSLPASSWFQGPDGWWARQEAAD